VRRQHQYLFAIIYSLFTSSGRRAVAVAGDYVRPYSRPFRAVAVSPNLEFTNQKPQLSAVLFFFLPTVDFGRQFDAIKTYVCFSQNVRIFSRKHTYVLMKT
jgi:uncharacterized protein YggT (Ycf19 family)